MKDARGNYTVMKYDVKGNLLEEIKLRSGALAPAILYTPVLADVASWAINTYDSVTTPTGNLSPLQANIDLALSPNRGLPDALLRIDLRGMRSAGFEIPQAAQVGRSYGMPGGGLEMQFPYAVPPQFISVVPK